MKRPLSIWTKILFLCLCFTAPTGVLAYFVSLDIQEQAHIAQLEIIGDRYQAAIEPILRDVIAHKVLVHRCPDGKDCTAQVAALATQIDKDIAALKNVESELGAQLEFTEAGLAKRNRQNATAGYIEKIWKVVKALTATGHGPLPNDIDNTYGNILDSANMMITHLGDISTLILDPELDTYHLMADTLLTLPQNQNRIGVLIGLAQAAYAHGFSMTDRVALIAQAAELSDMDIGQVTLDTNTAINENANEFHGAVASFNKNVPPLYRDWLYKNNKLADLSKQLATEDKPSVTLDQYIEIANAAHQSSFAFWDAAVTELDNLLRLRAHYYLHKCYTLLLSTAFAVLICFWLAYRVKRSITLPMERLAMTLSEGTEDMRATARYLKLLVSGR